MSTIPSIETKIQQPKGQILSLPKCPQSPDNHTSKFIKLFKTNLYKNIQHQLQDQNNKKNKIKLRSPHKKYSFVKYPLHIKTEELQSETKTPLDFNESAVQILSERQKLVKSILNNGQSLFETHKHKNKINNQRCKTLQNNQSSKQETEFLTEINSSRKFKLPAKFRMTFSKNKPRSNSNWEAFPILDKKMSSPIAKKFNFSNLQVINKYHQQISQQHRSNQFLSIPISISSVANSNRKSLENQNLHSKIKIKINNNPLLNSKNQKIKLALQSFTQAKYLNEINPEKLQFQRFHKIQHDQSNEPNFSELSQKKVRKTQQVMKKPYESQFLISPKISKSNKKQKLKQRLPLDDYFKPWENSQFSKQQNSFNPSNYFN